MGYSHRLGTFLLQALKCFLNGQRLNKECLELLVEFMNPVLTVLLVQESNDLLRERVFLVVKGMPGHC